MITVLLLLYLCFVAKANYNVICNNNSEDGLHFDYANDGVAGRFLVKWCTPINNNVTDWALDLKYKTLSDHWKCNSKYMLDGTDHSSFQESVQLDLNCTNVCFNAYLDLIFNATCYHIDTRQISKVHDRRNQNIIISKTVRSNKSYHYIESETTPPMEQFTNSRAFANCLCDGEIIILDWFLGYVPASQYRVDLDSTDGKQNGSIAMNCSALGPAQTAVRCRALAPPGCYLATFEHRAPWITANFHDIINIHYPFCYTSEARVAGGATPRASFLWAMGAAGGALALALLLLLLLLAHRARLAGKLRRGVLRDWLATLARTGEPSGEARAANRVLLLYAPDVARAAEPLRALLRYATESEAVDLYRAESVDAAAPAAGAWLRALLLRPDTRVLLVQSPALSLYCSRSDEGGAPLAPLLGARAMWRQPHAADPLLRLALRLLAEGSAGEPLPYKKYYVASVAGAAEAVPALTPQRRYLLPGAAELLLRDLAPGAAPPTALLRQLEEALQVCSREAADPDCLLRHLLVE